MKFLAKTLFIYLFIFVQSLIPVAREISFLPKVMTNSSAVALECDDDGSCTVDLKNHKGDKEGEIDKVENVQSGEEGLFNNAGARWINNILIWVVGIWTALTASRCWISGMSCGWSTGLAMAAFVAFIATELGGIWSHSKTVDQLKFDIDTMKKCSRVITDDVDDEDTECNDAKSQYQSIVKQREAYDSATTGLWIKFIGLIVMEVALLAALGVEIFAMVKGALTDKQIIALSSADAAACLASAKVRLADCGLASAGCVPAITAFIQGVTENVTLNHTPPQPIESSALCGMAIAKFNTLKAAVVSKCQVAGINKCCSQVTLASAFEKFAEANCPS